MLELEINVSVLKSNGLYYARVQNVYGRDFLSGSIENQKCEQNRDRGIS